MRLQTCCMNSFFILVGIAAGAVCAVIASWSGYPVPLKILSYWLDGLSGVLATAALVLLREHIHVQVRAKR